MLHQTKHISNFSSQQQKKQEKVTTKKKLMNECTSICFDSPSFLSLVSLQKSWKKNFETKQILRFRFPTRKKKEWDKACEKKLTQNALTVFMKKKRDKKRFLLRMVFGKSYLSHRPTENEERDEPKKKRKQKNSNFFCLKFLESYT